MSQFKTGAIRDDKSGLGACDLLPFMTLAMVYQNDRYGVMGAMDAYYRFGRISELVDVLRAFMLGEFDNQETAILELSIHYQEGAQKYAARNWEKGIPTSSFADSAVRHYLKHMRGDKDERHDRAFMWNVAGLLWTRVEHPEMDDFHQAGTNEL